MKKSLQSKNAYFLSLSSPHTGWQDYQDGVKRIPSACITMEDAELMWRMAQRGQKIVVRLTMGAKTLPDADSFNTVAEITGWQHPEQVDLAVPSQTPACLTYLSILSCNSLSVLVYSVGQMYLGGPYKWI